MIYILLGIVIVILAITSLKWYISTMAVLYFCETKWRIPTEYELKACTTEAVKHFFGLDH